MKCTIIATSAGFWPECTSLRTGIYLLRRQNRYRKRLQLLIRVGHSRDNYRSQTRYRRNKRIAIASIFTLMTAARCSSSWLIRGRNTSHLRIKFKGMEATTNRKFRGPPLWTVKASRSIRDLYRKPFLFIRAQGCSNMWLMKISLVWISMYRTEVNLWWISMVNMSFPCHNTTHMSRTCRILACSAPSLYLTKTFTSNRRQRNNFSHSNHSK